MQDIFNDDHLLVKIYHFLIISTAINGNHYDLHKLNKLRLLNYKSSQIIPINFLRWDVSFIVLYSKIKSALIKILIKPYYYYEQHNNSFYIKDPKGPQGEQGLVGDVGSCSGPIGATNDYNDDTKDKYKRLIEKSLIKFTHNKHSSYQYKISNRSYIKNKYRKSKKLFY